MIALAPARVTHPVLHTVSGVSPSRCRGESDTAKSVLSVESKSSWIVASVVLVILTLSFGGPWIIVIALKSIAAETGGMRTVPALASSLAWLGLGAGGIVMGAVAERVGVRWTVIFGAVMICAGLALSAGGESWQLYVGQGLFMGFLGIGSMNAPFYVYVSRWFDRHRGSALALISSGAYMAGAVWPPLFERIIAYAGWRQTMVFFGVFELVAIAPLAAIFLRQPPKLSLSGGRMATSSASGRVLGWPPNFVFLLLLAGVVFCCIPMAMPQAHLPALCSDLGFIASHGAAMVSVLLGTAFLSRQFWGLISDRVGGLKTALIGSGLQMLAMIAFVVTQDEIGLFTVSAAAGFGFAGIIPANILAIRELFPVSEAYWRIPTLLLMSGSGMAAGAWLAGVLYDHFGFYAPAFAAGVAANAVNFLIIAVLVSRQRKPVARHAFS
jgi:MFS family permease